MGIARGSEYAGYHSNRRAASLLGVLREAETMNTPKNEQAIQKAVVDFMEVWNKRDARAFSLVFAEDADFHNVVG
jgi:hypothetical protein